MQSGVNTQIKISIEAFRKLGEAMVASAHPIAKAYFGELRDRERQRTKESIMSKKKVRMLEKLSVGDEVYLSNGNSGHIIDVYDENFKRFPLLIRIKYISAVDSVDSKDILVDYDGNVKGHPLTVYPGILNIPAILKLAQVKAEIGMQGGEEKKVKKPKIKQESYQLTVAHEEMLNLSEVAKCVTPEHPVAVVHVAQETEIPDVHNPDHTKKVQHPSDCAVLIHGVIIQKANLLNLSIPFDIEFKQEIGMITVIVEHDKINEVTAWAKEVRQAKWEIDGKSIRKTFKVNVNLLEL